MFQLHAARRVVIALVSAMSMFAPTREAVAQCDFERVGLFREVRYNLPHAAEVDGDLAVVLTGDAEDSIHSVRFGMLTFDISTLDDPQVIDQRALPARPLQWAFADGRGLVLDAGGFLHTYDTSSGAGVVERGAFDVSGTYFDSATKLELVGSRLFLGNTSGFAIYELGDLSAPPTLLGSISLGHEVLEIDVDTARNLAFAPRRFALEVFDVSDPAHPVLVTVRPEISGDEIHRVGSRFYTVRVTSFARVQGWDLSNPTSPVFLGEWSPPETDAEGYVVQVLTFDDRMSLTYYLYHSVQDDEGEWWDYGTSFSRLIDLTSLALISDVPYVPVTGSKGLSAWRINHYVQSAFALQFSPDFSTYQVTPSLSVPTGASLVAVDGSRIYALDMLHRFIVTFDAGDSSLSRPLAQARVPPFPSFLSYTTGMLVIDGIVCLQAGYAWHFFDVSDPGDMQFLRSMGVGEYFNPPKVERGIGLQASWGHTALRIWDWTDPAEPVEIGAYATPSGEVRDFAFVPGTSLVAVAGAGELTLLDLADPANPQVTATLQTSAPLGSGAGMVASRDYVFGAFGYGQHSAIHVFDIGDPMHPFQVGTHVQPYIGDLAMFENLIVVTPSAGAIRRSFDFSDPSSLRLVDEAADGPIADLLVHIGFVYTAGGSTGGLRAFDLQNGTTPAFAGSVSLADTSFGVASHRDLAFVSDYSAGLRIVDVSNAAEPVEVGFYDTPDRAYQTVIVEEGDSTLACVADGSTGLLVLDVTDPGAPTPVSSLATSDLALALAVDGNFAYLACRFEGLQIVDITDPAAPVLVGSVDTPGSAQSVTIDGQLAYVADGSGGVHVIDIANRSLPAIIGTYDTPSSARQVLIRGPVAYVPDRTTGLIALDIADPTDPRHISTLAGLGDARSITDYGHLAFVADFNGLVHMIDIADPLNMQLLQSTPTLGTARAITNDGSTIYLADGDAGLTILEARPCWSRPCPADLNDDHSLNFFDVQMFLNAYAASDGLADWNDDGHINFFDVQRYLSDFSEGCVF